MAFVFDSNIDKLADRVEKLNRRAAKLGVPALQLHIGERETVYRCPSNGSPALSSLPGAWGADAAVVAHERAEVTLSGETPKLAGWTFAAVVDHLSNGVITRYPLGPEIDLTPYRGAEATCDHCRVNRKRHETFIVVHDTGNEQRVGRTCLADFLGHSDPSGLIGHLNLWAKAFEALEGAESAGFGSGTPFLILADFLGEVAREMRQHGWLSRGKAYEQGGVATADAAQNAYWATPPTDRNGRVLEDAIPTAEDRERAAGALAWVRGLTDAEVEGSDYLYNLRAVCASETIRPKRGGLAGSVIQAAGRAYEKALAKSRDAGKSNLHVGNVGERLTLDLTLVGLREIDGFYGVSVLHRFEDAAGNLLVWFASGSTAIVPDESGTGKRAMKLGETAKLAGTVKGHDNFKGRLQTKLNRVGAAKVKKARKKAAKP